MIFNDLLKKDDLVFDIGANNGNKTKLFSSLGCRIVCVEPQTGLSISLKDIPNVISVESRAVSSTIGEKPFYICKESHALHTLSEKFVKNTGKKRFKEFTWPTAVIITTITLDFLIQKYGIPNFCKIDVEGHESEILKGLSVPVNLSIEHASEMREENTFVCIDLLTNLSSKYLFNYSSEESHNFSLINWVTADEIKKYLESLPDEELPWGDVYAKVEKLC